jgi:NADH-quinone oxidoreductase subunit N
VLAVLGSMLGVAAEEATKFNAPSLDLHALLPEFVLAGVIVVVLLADLFLDETRKYLITTIAGVGVLFTLIPILTLSVDGADRSMFNGAYVVDNFALVLKAMFIVAGYITLLMSSNELSKGDYYEGEFSFLLLCSLLGMVVMCSSRDLITIFIALETLSIPAYMLAGWRKRDTKSNEASIKYYLLGVVASAVMLYGMSLVYGVTGATQLSVIGGRMSEGGDLSRLGGIGVFLVVVGFLFKVSAVPFHQWAPDTYEGAPTPVTAFLSVASKAAGFIALMQLIFIAFFNRSDVWQPIFWVLAAATMTVGNVIALRQTNIVRLLAYSSVAQAGFIMVPFAVAAENVNATSSAFQSVVTYLLIYTVMNLGAFTVVIAVARKTRSGEVSSYGGLFEYAPALTVVMTVFMTALAGIPPLGGWFAKFTVFRSVLDAGSFWPVVLGAVTAVNAVIAFGYYGRIIREMWMKPVPDGDRTTVTVAPSLVAALGLCAIAVVATGVVPQVVGRFAELSLFQ